MPIRVTVELYSDTELELRIRHAQPSVIDTTAENYDESGVYEVPRPLAKCEPVRQLRAAGAE